MSSFSTEKSGNRKRKRVDVKGTKKKNKAHKKSTEMEVVVDSMVMKATCGKSFK